MKLSQILRNIAVVALLPILVTAIRPATALAGCEYINGSCTMCTSGACVAIFCDFDGDGEVDLYASNCGPE